MIKKIKGSKKAPRRHTDLIGVDFSTTATKVVRLKQSGDDVVLSGIDLLPAVDFSTASSRLELPRNISTYYGCLCYSCPNAVMRMVNTPIAAEENSLSDTKLRELLNVKEDYRTSATLISRGKGRMDSSFLAAAVPQDDVGFMLNMFPSGPPAPASLEISGLAVITAFLHARGAECADQAVCLIEAGEANSNFVLMNQGKVLLVGKMDFGIRRLCSKLAEDLGVDEDLARSILGDRSINISSSLSSVLGPFAKQISISKDFVERHQGCRVSKVYVSGGLSLMPCWTSEIGDLLHAEVAPWSPLENISYDAETLPADIEGQATRFAAAIGAALGGFESQ
ncbi:MAG: pilus assembly protein PilM [Pontiellaceae bacterium]|nr:pilus assembly protein PilM [Pontiellaceae bacterium]MBN2785255.1 pilus assembly protein PilM [Pontiellaceae bacterium]